MTVLIEIAYLVASVLFILGLKRLSSPKTARSGNLLGALGMLLAVIATLAVGGLDWVWILVGVAIGGGIGAFLARWVQMTAMPQMVAVFNAFGGGASMLVASVEYLKPETAGASVTVALTIVLSVLIGAVTFSGSFLAWAKLEGHFERALTYPGQQVINALTFVSIIAIGAWITIQPGAPVSLFVVLGVLSLVFGLMFVMPIGGADMPVVVALLTSYSGLAASATGFVLDNNVLIIAGALVGASGLILTNIMCRAMNRSLANVLFSAFGSQTQVVAGGEGGPKLVKDGIFFAGLDIVGDKLVEINTISAGGRNVASRREPCSIQPRRWAAVSRRPRRSEPRTRMASSRSSVVRMSGRPRPGPSTVSPSTVAGSPARPATRPFCTRDIMTSAPPNARFWF